MRNMLFAMTAFAVCCICTTVNAATPADGVIQDAAQAVVESVPAAPASVPAQPAPMQSASEGIITEAAAPVAMQHQVVQQVQQPQRYHYHRHPAPKKKNVLQKLIELERRKNAWLKKTFLNK